MQAPSLTALVARESACKNCLQKWMAHKDFHGGQAIIEVVVIDGAAGPKPRKASGVGEHAAGSGDGGDGKGGDGTVRSMLGSWVGGIFFGCGRWFVGAVRWWLTSHDSRRGWGSLLVCWGLPRDQLSLRSHSSIISCQLGCSSELM